MNPVGDTISWHPAPAPDNSMQTPRTSLVVWKEVSGMARDGRVLRPGCGAPWRNETRMPGRKSDRKSTQSHRIDRRLSTRAPATNLTTATPILPQQRKSAGCLSYSQRPSSASLSPCSRILMSLNHFHVRLTIDHQANPPVNVILEGVSGRTARRCRAISRFGPDLGVRGVRKSAPRKQPPRGRDDPNSARTGTLHNGRI